MSQYGSPNYLHTACRVAGPSATIVWQTGSVFSLTRTGAGVYELAVQPGADLAEHTVDVDIISTGIGYDEPSIEYVTDNLIRIRTSANGNPFDADFTVEIYRVRTGPLDLPLPAPAPIPGGGPPGSPGEPIVVDMFDAVPVPGSNDVPVGFQLRDINGNPIALVARLQLASFDLPNAPSAFATLGGATAGTILAGNGTQALVVETDATGLFSCNLNDPIDETVMIAADTDFGSPILDCREIDSVTFTP